MPGATKACQPTATAHPGQSSPSGEDPGTKPASISHSPPCWGARGGWGLAVGVAVGGRGLGGGAVAGRVAVLVGGRGVGVGEGRDCMSVGAAVVAGTGGLGLDVAFTGEADGDDVGVALGWSVGVGCGVLVARAGTTRVLVGVAVTAGFPGAHRIISNPSRPVPTRKNQSHRCLLIAKCHILCGFPSSFKPTTLYSRTEQATSAPKG